MDDVGSDEQFQIKNEEQQDQEMAENDYSEGTTFALPEVDESGATQSAVDAPVAVKKEEQPPKRKNNSKPVECMDMDGNLLREFKSGANASTELGLTQGDISQCCRGLKDSAGGFKFRFKDIEYFQSKPIVYPNPRRLANLLDSIDTDNSMYGGVDVHNFGIGMRSKQRRDSGRHSLPASSSGAGFADESFDGYGGESYGDLQGLTPGLAVSDFKRKIMESAKRPCIKWIKTDIEFGANQVVLKKWVSENGVGDSYRVSQGSTIVAGPAKPKAQPERKKYNRR